MTRDKLKVLDLFSGIGGFSLGLERTGGFETVGFCEIDSYCQKVLKKHWPDVAIHDDINTLNVEDIYNGKIDVITGGYPCQPFSVAGNRKGHKDDRHLWPRMFEIIKQARPTWIICENVNGHITMGLDEVLHDLESEGYASKPFVIPACAIDAPHRRDRVWIVANTNRERLEGSEEARDSCAEGKKADKQLAGFCESEWRSWPTEPRICRVANGVSDRMDRIRGLGNAVVPGVVSKIGQAILDFK